MTITLHEAGWGYTHEPGFAIDRPHGLPQEWILVQFTRPAWVHDLADPVVPAGRVVLWAPGQAHRYHGHGCGLGNHWCHAAGLAPLAAELGIPSGQPRAPTSVHAVGGAFRTLAEERRRQDPGWREATAGTLVALLRLIAPGTRRGALSDLRNEILSDLARPWKLPALAARLGCSVPTLHRRWRAAFGASPVDDLITARIERARWLIAVAGEPVAAAARSVGYADARYFARLCHRHTGASPSSWRKSGVPAGQYLI